MPKSTSKANPRLEDLVFIGFNSRVAALDRYSGQTVWSWKSPHAGIPVLLLDGDRLIVSVNGYTFCLDPLFGQLVWQNDLPGMGVGIPTLASIRGSLMSPHVMQVAAQQAAASSTAATTSAAAAAR